MKKGLISVIIPVYKVEKEIRRCIESVLKQSYQNIEIILVDDGSPDDCPQICDEYKEKDNRIKVIHKKNGGLSDARNTGLDIANGEYIAFVDSDDWVENDYIECLYTNAVEENADISVIGYTMVWEGGRTRRFSQDTEYYVFNREQAIRELLIQNKFSCMVCQKLYKAYIFQDIRFPVGKLYEDVAIGLSTFLKANKVVVSGRAKYNYFQRGTSIVNSKFNVEKLYFLKCCRDIIEYSDTHSKIYDKEAHTFYLRALMTFILEIYQSNSNYELLKDLENEIRKQKHYIWRNPYLQFRKKMVMTLICLPFPKKILVNLWRKRTEKKDE